MSSSECGRGLRGGWWSEVVVAGGFVAGFPRLTETHLMFHDMCTFLLSYRRYY